MRNKVKRRQYLHRYYLSHRAYFLAYNRRWKLGNKKKVEQYRRRTRQLHLKEMKAYQHRYYLFHKKEYAEHSRRWYSSHVEHSKQYHRRYRKKHADARTAYNQQRRACKKRSPGIVTKKQWTDLKVRYALKCLACKRQEPIIKLSMDHVIPLSRQGSHTIDNIQPLCRSCNSRKQTQTTDFRVGFVLTPTMQVVE